MQNKKDELECYSRRDNLIFVGIPTNAAEVANADNELVAENSTLLVTKCCTERQNRL